MPKIPIQNLIKNPLKLNEHHDLIFVPKSLSIISSLPVFEAQDQILKYLYHNIIKPKRAKAHERIIKIPARFIAQFQELYEKCQKNNQEYQIDELWQNVFHYDRNLVSKTTNLISQENEISIKNTQLCEFYISAVFSLMNMTTKSKETILLKPYGDEDPELIRYRINQTMGINLTGYNFKILFKKLSLVNVMKIIKFILLERKIIIFSQNPGDIPNITETLLALISPMLIYLLIIIKFNF